MREIEYRGWDSHNKRWVYGLLLMDVKGHYRIQYDPRRFSVIVDPDSIGEYTGIKDENDKKIYEGDICEVVKMYPTYGKYFQTDDPYSTERLICVCSFIDGAFRIRRKYLNRRGEEKFEEGSIKKCKVIGNIYETPELLKTE